MIHFLCNGKQQIVADGNLYLREHCINGQVGVSEIVTQESIDIVCGIILINNQAERVWMPFRGQRSGKSDDCITYNSGLLVYWPFLQHLILHVVLGSCHKERLLSMEMVKQLLEVNVALVHEIVASGLYGKLIALESWTAASVR